MKPRRDLFAFELSDPLTLEAKKKAASLGSSGIDIVFGSRAPEAMIIVSQGCDLVASLDDEPLCKAVPVVAWPANEPLPQANSSRRFVVDRERRLVADHSRRYIFEKALLPDEDALQLIPDADDWRSFRAWCARRYSRHAFPDDFVETVVAALKFALQKQSEEALEPIQSGVL